VQKQSLKPDKSVRSQKPDHTITNIMTTNTRSTWL